MSYHESHASVALRPDPVTRLNTALEGHHAIERELGEGGVAEVIEAWKCRRGHRRQDQG